MSDVKMIKKINKNLAAITLSTLGMATHVNAAIEKLANTQLNWQHVNIPSQPSLRGSAIAGDSLWVTGTNNSVWVSQDGGKNWQNRSVKNELVTDFRDIEVFDSQTAIVMGVGEGKQSILYKTTDGGKQWETLLKNTDKTGFFDSIAFWDPLNGLLMGDPVDGYYVIKRTEDGGKTWQRTTKNNLPKILKTEMAFAASGNTLIVGKVNQAWLTTGGQSASVYYSQNSGKTWQRQNVPIYKDTKTAGGYGLALNKHDEIFVVGGDYHQRDKAYPNMAFLNKNNQWQSVSTGQRGLRSAMSCEKIACITTGKKGNDISFDQGKTWQPLPNSKLNAQGYFTLASSNNRFLFAGENGKVAILSVVSTSL